MLSEFTKQYRFAHCKKQMEEREIELDVEFLIYLAEKTEEENVAIVLGTKEYLGNLNNVILIIRDFYPVTVECRRKTQSLNKNVLEVDNIIYESISL